MKLENLVQPPWETTLMGVLHAVLRHFGRELSPARVYGGSGHAFLVNIHEALCPSSPYCWKADGMWPLLENLGVSATDLGFFHAGSTQEERAAVEAKVRDHLDAGKPCSLCNMEHQLIYGYEDGKFLTARPWPKNPDYPPGTLTFGDWTEFGDEIHVNFFAYEPHEPSESGRMFRESIEYALDLNRNPGKYEFEKYAIGPGAWDNWAAAAEEFGGSHGNWWNGVVWAECRDRAAEYLDEMATEFDGDVAARVGGLAAAYAGISDQVGALADKEMPPAKKATIAKEVKAAEEAAILQMETLLAAL